VRLVLLVILILLIIGALPIFPYSAGWGPYPATGFGAVLILLLILALLGIL
jgi:low affinity Fe/Cu permease